MSKIKEFLKNYKKIIIVAFVALVVILFLTGIYNLVFYRSSIGDNNDVQLNKINDKYIELSEKYAQVEDAANNIRAKDALVMMRLLTLEPDDANDSTYLNRCVELMQNTNGIIIFNKNRQLINQAGEIRDIDYTESYYDELFMGAVGEAVIVNDIDSDDKCSICVASDRFFVLIQKADMLTGATGTIEETLWKMALHSIGLNSSSYFAAVETDDNKIIYSDYDDFTGQILSMEEKAWNYYEIEGSDYYIQSCNEIGDIKLLALTPRDKIIQRCSLNFKLVTALIVSTFLILMSYIICLRQSEKEYKGEYRILGKYFLKNQTGKYRSLTVLVLVVMTVVFMVMYSLHNNSFTMEYLNRETDNCKETVEAVSNLSEKTSEIKELTMYGHAGIAGEFLSLHNEYVNKSGMKKLSAALDVEYITIFDSDGSTLCTASPMDHINIMDDPESSLYELRYVLMGKEGMAVCGDSERISENEYIYAVPRRNSDGVADGAIALITQAGISNSVYQAFGETADIIFKARTNQEKTFVVNKNGVLVATEKTDGDVNVDDKIAETSLKDGYLGPLKIDDVNFLASVTYLESYDWYLYIVMPANQFGDDILQNYIILFIMLILLSLWMCYDGLGSRKHFEELAQDTNDAGEDKQGNPKWAKLSIGRKMGRILSVYIYIFSVFLIVVRILYSSEIISNDGATYIVSGQWDKSVNGYSILGNICVIFVFYTAVSFIHLLVKRLETFLGKEGATLCKLINSVVSYGGTLICAYIVVTNFGVDAAAALASLGIIGFAFTFGAQELIKDMISGIFILFEGRFKVGDLIDVDGEWFWIRSIGVRTTVVEGRSYNIRVINNSNMTGIMNIQNASYRVNVDFLLDNKYKADEIREIITAEFPSMKEAMPSAATEPIWKGVQDITGSGTLYRIRAFCPPIKSGSTGRAIRSELKRILDEHGIEIAQESIIVYNEDAGTK